MIEPVRREFLRDAAARKLREAFAAGLWKGHLPSEAVLCQKLHVSRRAIRSALVVDVIRHGAGRSRHVKIVPEFAPGQTLVSGSRQSLTS